MPGYRFLAEGSKIKLLFVENCQPLISNKRMGKGKIMPGYDTNHIALN
jgi:hypothetical protein